MRKIIEAIFGRRKPEPPPPPTPVPAPPVVSPGEVKVERNWVDDPMVDTTVITVGGQVHPERLEAIRAILEGRAHATRYRKPHAPEMKPVGGII